MERKHVVILMFAAFMAGDTQAVIRTRALTKRNRKKMEKHMQIQQMKINALVEALTAIHDGVANEKLFEQLETDAQFINLIEEEM